MNRREEAQEGLQRPDLTEFEVVEAAAEPTTIAMTSRYTPDQLRALLAEAERRGVKKTQIPVELALERMAQLTGEDEAPVLVRPADLLRAVRSVGRPEGAEAA